MDHSKTLKMYKSVLLYLKYRFRVWKRLYKKRSKCQFRSRQLSPDQKTTHVWKCRNRGQAGVAHSSCRRKGKSRHSVKFIASKTLPCAPNNMKQHCSVLVELLPTRILLLSFKRLTWTFPQTATENFCHIGISTKNRKTLEIKNFFFNRVRHLSRATLKASQAC